MSKKYELTDETMEFDGHTLHRIRALKSFSDVMKGDLGGWVESEENLWQSENCWVYDNAKVYDEANVEIDAVVRNEACVCNKARVTDSKVMDKAFVSGLLDVDRNAIIKGSAKVTGVGPIHKAVIKDNAVIRGSIFIDGQITIGDNAIIDSSKIVYLEHYYEIGKDAYIQDNSDIIEISMMDDHQDFYTFYRTKNKETVNVISNVYSGSLSDFENKMKLEDKKIPDKVKSMLDMVKGYFELHKLSD
jgi:UDP-3-O-[3-hydroxymyristoyl] glucosamine N-acyltransferase